MALQAGLLNVGGYLACHRFVSHITGFATLFGMEVINRRGSHAMGMLTVPLFFLFGSMVSGVLVDLRLKQHKKPRYYVSFGLMFLIVLTVFLGGIWGDFGEFGTPVAFGQDYMLLILLCFVCGMQNAAVSTISKSVIRTTHLTGITTDLGIGIIRILYRDKLQEEIPNEGKANLMRMGIILFFVLGSVLGAYLFTQLGYMGFAAPVLTSGALFAAMFYFQVIRTPISSPPSAH